MKKVNIDNKTIGKEAYTFVIAEAGVNHNGNLELAVEMVKAAKKAGADAIKFQSFKAAKICDRKLEEVKKVEGLTGGSKSSYDMYKSLELSDKDHKVLAKEAKNEGIMFSSSVFDLETAVFLNKMKVPFFKISSGDITFLPLIKKVATFNKPIILSTGMSTVDEILEAVRACQQQGNEKIILLHCNAVYPPPANEVNLNAMHSMREIFKVPIGFSDHTKGFAVTLGAVAMGAAVIEKHFTLSNDLDGPDHFLSLNPKDFKEMVAGIKAINKAKGSFDKQPSSAEIPNIASGRRSIMALKDIRRGEKITKSKITMIKPAKGIPPKFFNFIVGKKAVKAIKKHEPLTWDCI